jgi:hypothetical protein
MHTTLVASILFSNVPTIDHGTKEIKSFESQGMRWEHTNIKIRKLSLDE